jgi:hypothetical protein
MKQFGTGRKLREILLPAATLLLIVAVHLGTLRRGHSWGDDFAQYVHHAKNLALGIPYGETGYIYDPSYTTIGPPCYPPGCPFLLTPFYLFFGLNLEAMKLAMIASLACFLGFVYLSLRRELPLPHALAGMLLVGLNRKWLGGANHVASDLPFMGLLYLTVFMLQKAYGAEKGTGPICRNGPEGAAHKLDLSPFPLSPRWRYLLPATLFMYLTYATRTLGGLLLPAVLIHDFLRYRRRFPQGEKRGGRAVLVGGMFIVLAVVQGIKFGSNAAYFDQYNIRPSVFAYNFAYNAVHYLKESAGFWHNGYFGPLGGLIFLAVTALAALGYVSSLRRQITFLEIFPVLYLLAVLLFPGYSGARYLQPIFPFYLLFAFRGLEHPWLAMQAGLKNALLATLGVAVAGSYLTAATQVKLEINEGVCKPESVALFDYVRTHTAEDDVIVFIKPRAMSLLTSRRASAYHMPPDDARLWDYFDQIGARWLIVVENDDAMVDVEEPARLAYLRDFARRNASRLTLQFGNADFSLYRIAGRSPK